MKVLFTGFETDGEGRRLSATWVEGLKTLAGEEHLVESLLLPATWDGCFVPLRSLLNQGWDAVVCVGAKESEAIAVERVALNESSVSIRDCEGRRPRSKVIDPDGDAGYWTGLPYRELSITLTEAGLPAAPSHAAGRGLANYVFYQLMHWISLSRRKLSAGLLQFPLSQSEDSIGDAQRGVFLSCVLDTLADGSHRADSLILKRSERLESLKGSPTP